MTKYPCGNDIAVNWTLDLGGMSVDLAECSLLFEYYTGLGSKTIPGSEYSIDGNVLSWTFKGEDQVVYGVYGLRLVASSGGEDIVFNKPDAFEIVHGIAADEEQTLPLSSSVETEQEPAADPEPEQSGTPVYVSSSPIHVEKVPLGSNITVRWRLLTTEEFDFRLEDCTLNLYYAAAGSGFKMATGYTLDTTDGYVLVWNFAAGEQVRYGLYSLLLDVRQGGSKVATLVKDDAFALVHRRGSVFPDRVIDFESVVTTMGGGALYTLLDVINDGYSTVYRSDGITPAQRDDLLVYNGAKWYAIDAGSLSAIRGLRNDFTSLELTTEGIFARVTDLEGDVGELWLTAREFGVRMSDAEGYIGQLTLTAREFEVRMSDAEGNIGQLSLTAQQFAVRMSDAEGNIGQLALTAQQFGVRMSDIEGNVGELALTAEEFGVRMTNAEGSIGQLSLTAEEFAVRMSDTEGNVSLLQQTATSLTSQIQDAQGNISTLQQTATSLTSRIQNAEGSISTIAQTAESIQLQVDNQQGDIATLEVSARAITSRVSDAEGNISTLEQTASSLTSQIQDAEGNISTLQQTAASLTSQIEDAEGNISTLQQTATQISSRVTSIEGEFGEGGRVTVAESEIIQQAGLIATKVSQTEYDANNQAISTHFSTIEQTASQISTRVAAVESEFGEGGRVTVAESTIVQQAGLIATKVSQTEYDANNQAISTHFSTIEQTASQISTRVAAVESEFGEGGRVTVAESTIVQQAGLIATKVSQTDYDANNQAISTRFSSIEQTAGEISASVTNVSNNLSNYEALTDAVLTNLQDQIDGVVETWYAEGAPTLSNYPVNTWAQADYPNHIGDLYYDKATGKAYRFMLDDEQDPAVYVWVELADEDIAKALALAGEKRRVFVSTPYAPYDAGDLWVKERTVNGETTREIYRCKRSRAAGETIDLANDWVPADDYAVTVNKANLKILADAIVGEVAAFTYDSEGKISSSSKSNITQTADAIRLSVSNQAIGTALGEGGSINDALLDTGIDITNGDITLTANHIKLQNQSAVSGLELVTIGTGANQRVVINTSSLNVAGIFTTSEWTGQNGIRAGILSDAETAAETYANSSAYLTNYVLPVVQQETSGLAVDAEYNYLKTALENRTTALGGLLLTSLIQLGATQSGSSWEVHSGISGEYVATSDTSDPDFVAGHGIAAWYGGAMVDREDLTHYWTAEQIAAWNAMTEEQREVSNLAAKTLFRMDGSGYLANGAISWGASGDLHLLDNVYIGPQMNQTLASISTFVTLLSTWFKDDTITINGTDYRVLRVNMASDPASTTGFQGVVWNGFFISGGDQIVISGTPGGGGGGGGATTLAGLDDTSISNPQAGQMLAWNGTKWVNTNAPTGSITSVSLAAGATNGTLHLVVNGTAQSDVAVTGLGSLAYKSSLAASDIPDLSATYQPKDSDLTSIAALTGAGFLKRASNGTWSLDGSTYLTTSTAASTYQTIIPANTYAPYSAVSDISTLQGYFTSGVANTAAKLSTVSKKVWGVTYWTSGGVPTDVTGRPNLYIGTTQVQTSSTNQAVTGITNLTMSGKLTIGSAEITYDATNGYLYINKPIVTDGDQIVISGTPGGGGGGGATTLAGLDDVQFTSLTQGQYLTYNGSKWINIAAPSFTLTPATASVLGGIKVGSGLSITSDGTLSTTNSGTVTQVKVGSTAYNPTDGVVSLPAYPTTLPASDVSAWAKASTKPSYAFSEITGTATISQVSGLQTALDGKQPLDSDLTAIAAISTGTGLLKRSVSGSTVSWSIDTNTYLTGITSTMVTNALGYTPANSTALSNYVLKDGDTMTGSLTLKDASANATFVKNVALTNTTGWERSIVTLQVDGSNKFRIGAYGNYTAGGSSNGIDYAFIGVNGYSGANLRFGSDSTLKWGTNTVWHAGNSNLSTVPWSCSSLTASGLGTFDTITLTNTSAAAHINFSRASWNYLNIPTGGSLALSIGGAGSSNAVMVADADNLTLLKTGGSEIILEGTAANSNAGDIIFRGRSTSHSGFKIASEYVTGALSDRQRLRIYVSQSDGGTDINWEQALEVNRYGDVTIGTTTNNKSLTVNGALTTASLQIGEATITWNSNGYLHIDKPLVTNGDQIVISGTPGGGGGGGATNLWGLDDVNIPHDSTYPGNGDLLSYDLSTHKWVNVAASSVGGVTSVAGRTGAITLTTSDITNIETWISDKGYITSYTDTKNTTGADNTTSKIFLVGPTAQTTSNGNARTYSNANVYASGGKLYSNAKEVVNLSDTQALTNKTYNGYTLAAACAKAVDTSISAASTSTNLPTSAAVASFVEGKGYITSYTNTWRGVYTGGTSRVGTGIDTKAINFAAGSNVTITYEAAGTGSGQSGNANYFNVKIAATDTTYSAGTGITLSSTTFSLTSGVCTVGTYRSVTVDTYGRVTSGTNPTTLAGYGITDAKFGTAGTDYVPITLGSATKNVLTAHQSLSAYLTSATAASTYVKLNSGAAEQTISSSISTLSKGVINLWRSSGDHYTFLGFSNGTTETYLGGIGFKSQSDTNLYHRIPGGTLYKIWDEGNLTQSVVTGLIGSTTYAPYHAAGYVKKDGDTMSGMLTANGGITTTDTTFTKTGGSQLIIQGTAANADAGSIIFRGKSTSHSGIKLASEYVSGAVSDRQRFRIYVSQSDGSTDINWEQALEVNRYGNVTIGTTTNNKSLTINGALTTTDAFSCSTLTTSGAITAGGALNITGSTSYSHGIRIHDFEGYSSIWFRAVNASGYDAGMWGITADDTGFRFRGPASTTATSANDYVVIAHGGALTANGGVVLPNGISISAIDTSSAAQTIMTISSSNNLSIGYGSAGAGCNTYIYGAVVSFRSSTSRTEVVRITANGRMGIGTTSPSQKLHVAGSILSTGDQVVSSDLTLKTNLKDVTYSVSDIAKARAVEFDWKDGRGHSMGSIAQDWLSIAPALVHGEEGNMSLAYGQLALVNTILLARQSESHEERIARLEKENAELKEEVKRLRMN